MKKQLAELFKMTLEELENANGDADQVDIDVLLEIFSEIKESASEVGSGEIRSTSFRDAMAMTDDEGFFIETDTPQGRISVSIA